MQSYGARYQSSWIPWEMWNLPQPVKRLWRMLDSGRSITDCGVLSTCQPTATDPVRNPASLQFQHHCAAVAPVSADVCYSQSNTTFAHDLHQCEHDPGARSPNRMPHGYSPAS